MKQIYLIFLAFLFSNNIQSQAFSLDTTFNVDYNFNFLGTDVYGLTFEPDGKIMVYGFFWDHLTNTSDIIRIFENGNRDFTWQYVGSQTSIGFVKRMNNDYIMQNISYSYIEKFNYSGHKTDTAWNNNIHRDNICGAFYFPFIFSDGSMMVGGDTTCNIISNKKRCLMKFLPDGNLDTNFKHFTNWRVSGIIKYSSDKLLLYGGFTKYDTISTFRICRIDTLGNYDSTFTSIFNMGLPRPVFIQNDGKIIIAGDFTFINSTTKSTLIRLLPDGSLDSTFNNYNSLNWSDSFPSLAIHVCPTSDGGYLVGGQFKAYQGYERHNIVKTDKDGFIDTNYFNGLGIDSTLNNVSDPFVYNIQRDSNDRYYLMGEFTYYNGQHVNPIIRIKGLSAGIEENKEKNNMQLYPNPAKDEVNLSFPKAIVNGVAEIYDVSGIKVKEILLKGRQSHYTISTEGLAAGFYIVSVRGEKGVVGVVKMMKCN